ncbi:putative oxidoreductase [Helianthus anomalus]
MVFKLACKRIGIVGLGNIGSRVARRLQAMDALVVCCALTNEAHHMINNKVMMALGQKGIIVNVARGAIIDEVELVKCLVEGEIGGAGLDVFENEPNVPKEMYELQGRPNAY